MADLATTYMGLKLGNPLIVGSSTHTISTDKIVEFEQAGAGAVVLKSIFEEQIRAEVADAYESLQGEIHPEAYEYLRADIPMQLGPAKYLERITEVKQTVSIPVIASINCTTPAEWVSFARKIEAAGADAVELNIYDIPDSFDAPPDAIEQRHLQLVEAITGTVGIPVAVKLGPSYTSIPNFVLRLSALNVDAVVLFNRFFQPDIDIEEMQITPAINLSHPGDIRLPLRWIAILRDHVACDLCLTTGVHDESDAVRAILAGANAFQICSVLYRHTPNHIGTILDGMRSWMARHGYESIDDARGLVSQGKLAAGAGFERAQYMKTLVGME